MGLTLAGSGDDTAGVFLVFDVLFFILHVAFFRLVGLTGLFFI